MSSISNSQRRELACRFCERKKPNCRCSKYWKQVYNKNRDEILKIHRASKSSPP